MDFLRDKLNNLWTIISNIDKLMSLRSPTPQENESLARECEKWCEVFPVLFPKRSLTRKMIEMSLVMPKFIREQSFEQNLAFRRRGRTPPCNHEEIRV